MGIRILRMKTMMIITILIAMTIMMINNDDNSLNAHDDSGDQTVTIFQTMNFREPLISEKPKFLTLTLMYGCLVINVARLPYYQPIMLL